MKEPPKENDLRSSRGMFEEMKRRYPNAPWATEAETQIERGVVLSLILTGRPIFPPTNQ